MVKLLNKTLLSKSNFKEIILSIILVEEIVLFLNKDKNNKMIILVINKNKMFLLLGMKQLFIIKVIVQQLY